MDALLEAPEPVEETDLLVKIEVPGFRAARAYVRCEDGWASLERALQVVRRRVEFAGHRLTGEERVMPLTIMTWDAHRPWEVLIGVGSSVGA